MLRAGAIAGHKPGSIIMTASLMSEASRRPRRRTRRRKGESASSLALAVDWAPFGVRVNGIGPGYIRTELTRSLQEDAEFDNWVKHRTPLGRWGRPRTSPARPSSSPPTPPAFITGQILYVDGGWLATF